MAQQTVVIGGGGPVATLGSAAKGIVVNDSVLDSLGPAPGSAGPAMGPASAPRTPVMRVPDQGATTAYRRPDTDELVVTRPSALLYPPRQYPKSRLTVAPPARTAGAAPAATPTRQVARQESPSDGAKLRSRLLVPAPASPPPAPKAAAKAPAPKAPALKAPAPKVSAPKVPAPQTAAPQTAAKVAKAPVPAPAPTKPAPVVEAPPPPKLKVPEAPLAKSAPAKATPPAPPPAKIKSAAQPTLPPPPKLQVPAAPPAKPEPAAVQPLAKVAPPPAPPPPAKIESAARPTLLPPPAPALTGELTKQAQSAPQPPAASAPPPPPAAAPAPSQQAALPKAPGFQRIRLLFEGESADLSNDAKANLAALAARMTETQSTRVQLLAYARDAGSGSSRARRLSLSRALAVRAFLIDKGIRSTRMDVRALGGKSGDGPADRVDIVPQSRS